MFAIRFFLTLAHTGAVAWVWWVYFKSLQVNTSYSPEVLATVHYHPMSVAPAIWMTAVAVFMWVDLIRKAFARESEPE